jgi:hypothetical protein
VSRPPARDQNDGNNTARVSSRPAPIGHQWNSSVAHVAIFALIGKVSETWHSNSPSKLFELNRFNVEKV